MKHCVSLSILCDYIGPTATARLVEVAGGETLKIPKRRAGRVWAKLAQAMGTDGAGNLVDNFGGEGLYIATNHAATVAQRRAEVARLRQQGHSFAEIARSFKVTTTYTERGVRKLAGASHSAHRHGAASAQLALPMPDPLAALFGGHKAGTDSP